jgi:cob(I)alamin adenosyltransferase
MMRQSGEPRKVGDWPRAPAGPRLRLMKIYTRAGDDGNTGLMGPGRVPKSAPRVEAYGTVDELNAALGLVRTLDSEGWLQQELETIQARLFTLGAELATTTPKGLASLVRLAESDVGQIEAWIDRLETELSPLQNFILPGGTPLGAQFHLARTVCRRAERRLVTLAALETIEALLVRYLNRLGDLLFVMARWCNARAGATETTWRPAHREP